MLNYNAPIEGQKSSIDGAGSDQMNTYYWLKKAIIQSRKDQYFMHPDNAKQFRHYLGIIANVGFNKAIAQLKQLNHK